MKLNQLLPLLDSKDQLTFLTPEGLTVPAHAHVTEVGVISKTFIDCGYNLRQSNNISFQVHVAQDVEHRLAPGKFKNILIDTTNRLNAGNFDVEVEVMHRGTIGKYGLDFNGQSLVLTPTATDCLAKEECNIPENQEAEPCCAPNSACC